MQNLKGGSWVATPQHQSTSATPASTSPTAIRVVLLGCGVVGSEVVRLLTTQRDDLTARIGATPELVGSAVQNLVTERDPIIDRSLLTTDADDLVTRADVVVEVQGGLDTAGPLLHRAISNGAASVTAHQELRA